MIAVVPFTIWFNSLQRRFPEYVSENNAFKRHHVRATSLAATVELDCISISWCHENLNHACCEVDQVRCR